MHEEWIPIVMFISIAVVVGLAMYFGYRTKHEMQATARVALDKGHELSPEFIAKLGDALPSPKSDLRRGVIFTAIAIALALFGWLFPEADIQGIMLSVAAFPFLIGVAYLGLHKFGKQ